MFYAFLNTFGNIFSNILLNISKIMMANTIVSNHNIKLLLIFVISKNIFTNILEIDTTKVPCSA